MVSEKILLKLLERLERALKRLESKKGVSFEEFEKNWEIHGAIIHELQVAIQAIIDIGTHLISELGLRSPNFYREIADILAEKNIIPRDYAETLKKIIAFRNILVHEYVELDLREIYKNFQNIEDLRKFAFYVLNFLEDFFKIASRAEGPEN
ncbi:MAG: DUF86 domain-containing protein [Caldimicrobium sp.]